MDWLMGPWECVLEGVFVRFLFSVPPLTLTLCAAGTPPTVLSEVSSPFPLPCGLIQGWRGSSGGD